LQLGVLGSRSVGCFSFASLNLCIAVRLCVICFTWGGGVSPSPWSYCFPYLGNCFSSPRFPLFFLDWSLPCFLRLPPRPFPGGGGCIPLFPFGYRSALTWMIRGPHPSAIPPPCSSSKSHFLACSAMVLFSPIPGDFAPLLVLHAKPLSHPSTDKWHPFFPAFVDPSTVVFLRFSFSCHTGIPPSTVVYFLISGVNSGSSPVVK